MLFGKMFSQNCPWTTFNKSYNLFLQCIKHEENIAYGCEECPSEMLDNNDKEENYPRKVEVHVGDAVGVGNAVNNIKGIPENKIFKNDAPEGSQIKKGVDVPDRTFLPNIKQRKVVEKLIQNFEKDTSITNAIKSINAKGKTQIPDHPHMKLIEKVLIHLRDNCNSRRVPIGYRYLLSELQKETPIIALICTHNPKSIELLLRYLNKEVDILTSKESLEILQDSMPIITESIYQIMEYEKQIFVDKDNFLPESITDLLKAMVDFKLHYDQKAYELDGQIPPKATQSDPLAEVYPAYPTHTEQELFHADSNKDKDEDIICQKVYPESGGITGGISHVTCVHGITKGFTAMKKGESPGMFTDVLVKRLPQRVKAKRRYFIYDNSCNCHKYAVRRYPWRIKNFTFVIDRHHLSNHTVPG